MGSINRHIMCPGRKNENNNDGSISNSYQHQFIRRHTIIQLQQNSEQLKPCSAFKHHSNIVPKIDPNDITMGYAGQISLVRQSYYFKIS